MNTRITLSILLLGVSLPGLAAERFVDSAEERSKIEQALPSKAIVQTQKPRRLLIFTRNVGYGGHPSIAYANEAFTLMGKKTGAFETIVSDDPTVFETSSLQRFDAVFFNNTVGNCFTNRELRANLMQFITGGGGLLGVHGTTVAFMQWPGATEDWPEFGYVIGARGANHKDSDEHVWMKVEQPEHPLNRVFGGSAFDFRDEFFRPHDPYSRERVRVLLSIDTSKTDVNKGQPRGDCTRPDNDYAVAWIRSYGQGRVFYCTIAHNPYVFWNPAMLQFYLGALQFALGDLPAPTTPSAYLSPATLAREQLGWCFQVQPPTGTLAQSMRTARELAVPYLGATSDLTLDSTNGRSLDPKLSDAELESVRLDLEKSNLRLLTYSCSTLPSGSEELRKLFLFGRKMGVQTLILPYDTQVLDELERLAAEYRIDVALRVPPGVKIKAKPLLKACGARDARIGFCADLSQAAIELGPRLKVARWQSGTSTATQKLARQIWARRLTPIFSFPTDSSDEQTRTEVAKFDSVSLNLVPRPK